METTSTAKPTAIIPNHVEDILNNEGVIVCVGTGRSGKTALGHYLASHSNKPVKLIAYPESAIQACPPGWESVSLNDVFTLQDCVLIFDDAALFASSRNFGTDFQKAWIQFQTIISHKGITILFIIQSMNLLDIGTLRSQRMVVLYKFSDLINIKYERDEFKTFALTSRNHIHTCRQRFPDLHPKSFVFDCHSHSVWTHPLPDHWQPILSTPYRDYIIEVKP